MLSVLKSKLAAVKKQRENNIKHLQILKNKILSDFQGLALMTPQLALL